MPQSGGRSIRLQDVRVELGRVRRRTSFGRSLREGWQDFGEIGSCVLKEGVEPSPGPRLLES
ncbi:MAG: hypothetical protein V3U69_04970 [Bacteroidota bacterium]